MEVIVIAGGTGFLGTELTTHFQNLGHEVRLLTRQGSNKQKGRFFWDPLKKEIDQAVWKDATILINLCGAGIADKRWTASRIDELFRSRLKPTEFLVQQLQQVSSIKQVIQASGGTCYGYNEPNRLHVESDPFGSDLVAQLTESWEHASNEFAKFTKLTTLRLGVVLGRGGGAVPKLASIIGKGFGSALGTGKQAMPWIHVDDVVHFAEYAIQKEVTGTFNMAADNCTNFEFTQALAKAMKKKLWLPAAPAFIIRLVLGNRSELLLKGLRVNNERVLSTGFEFKHKELNNALQHLFQG